MTVHEPHPQPVGEDNVCEDRISGQESKCTGTALAERAEHSKVNILHAGDDNKKSQMHVDADKWKPVLAEKDKLLMPPPGGFLRPSAG